MIFKKLRLKIKARRAIALLRQIDTLMKKSGMLRQARRQFWRDFIKSDTMRNETYNSLFADKENESAAGARIAGAK